MAGDFLDRQVADFGPGAGKKDDLAAIDVNGGFPTGGERVGLLRAEIHRLDLQ
jgi:uncharacterized small protein (DUF1192 family)